MAIERRQQRQPGVWRPFREMDEMERRFNEIFGQPFWPAMKRFPLEETEWVPAIDVYEKDDKFIVKAELPGMKKDDIEISVSEGMLNIKGEKKTETEVKKENYYHAERSYGSFFRSVTLPPGVDANKIEANFDNGVLEISAPKMGESAKPKKIQIHPKKQAEQK